MSSPPKGTGGAHLRMKAEHPPERVLLHRVLLLTGLLLAVLWLFWVDRDGLKDQIDGEVSFSDVVYFTAVTVTTVGYGDIVPVSDRARLVDAVLVTPLRLVIWLVFMGTAYELVVQKWLQERRMKRLEKALNNHVIVCGYGHGGSSCASELIARGRPAHEIVVIDRNPEDLDQAVAAGHIGLLGDAAREQCLMDAGVDRAECVMVCLGRDDTAVLTVLTARKLNPTVRIVSMVAETENVALIQQAGAQSTISPSQVGGYLMADSLNTSWTADYLQDLMSATGRVKLIERGPRPEELGRLMRELTPGLVVRLHRDGRFIGFWDGEATRIAPGDLLIEIVPVQPTT